MALALEKIFLQKVAQMPQKEVEVSPHAAKGKGKKSSAPGNEVTINEECWSYKSDVFAAP